QVVRADDLGASYVDFVHGKRPLATDEPTLVSYFRQPAGVRRISGDSNGTGFLSPRCIPRDECIAVAVVVEEKAAVFHGIVAGRLGRVVAAMQADRRRRLAKPPLGGQLGDCKGGWPQRVLTTRERESAMSPAIGDPAERHEDARRAVAEAVHAGLTPALPVDARVTVVVRRIERSQEMEAECVCQLRVRSERPPVNELPRPVEP